MYLTRFRQVYPYLNLLTAWFSIENFSYKYSVRICVLDTPVFDKLYLFPFWLELLLFVIKAIKDSFSLIYSTPTVAFSTMDGTRTALLLAAYTNQRDPCQPVKAYDTA